MKSIKYVVAAMLMIGAAGIVSAAPAKEIMFKSMMSPTYQDIKFTLTFDDKTSAQFPAKDLAMGQTVSIPIGNQASFTLSGHDKKGNKFVVATYNGKKTLPIEDGRVYSLSVVGEGTLFAAY